MDRRSPNAFPLVKMLYRNVPVPYQGSQGTPAVEPGTTLDDVFEGRTSSTPPHGPGTFSASAPSMSTDDLGGAGHESESYEERSSAAHSVSTDCDLLRLRRGQI